VKVTFSTEWLEVVDRRFLTVEGLIRCLVLDSLMELTILEIDPSLNCLCPEALVVCREVFEHGLKVLTD